MAKKTYEQLRREIAKHEEISMRLKQECKEREKAEKDAFERKVGRACSKAFGNYKLEECSSEELLQFFKNVSADYELIRKKREEKQQQQNVATKLEGQGGA